MVRLPNLNILRFFLAMVVLLGHIASTSKNLGIPHLSNIPLLHKGNLAVYFFFSLSGFLIIRQLFIETRIDRMNIAEFYKRRMLRILPLYYIILTAGIFIYFFLLPYMGVETGFRSNLGELLSYFLTFLPNVYIASHPNDVGGILFVLWSIGIEVQFYLVIPFVIIAFPKHIVKVLLALTLLHIVVSYLFPSIAGHYFNYYYFLFGGIISLLSLQGHLNFLGNKWIGAIILFSFIVLFFSDVVEVNSDIIYYLFTALVASLFICSIADFPFFEVRNRSLNYLGEISYGLYMYHMICVTAILYIFPKFHSILGINTSLSVLLINLSVTILTIITAHLSFQIIEKFFISRKRSPAAKQLPA